MTILHYQGWAQDKHSVSVTDGNKEVAIVEGDYLPGGLCLGRGDASSFSVDVDTGMIIGWDSEAVKTRICELTEPEDE